MCTEKVIIIISQHLHLDRQVSKYTAIRIQSKLKSFNKKVIGEVNLNNAFNELISTIAITEIYNESASIFQSIIDNADYEKVWASSR